jgi:hypothetical protein
MHFGARLLFGILLLFCATSARADLVADPGELQFPRVYIGATSAPLFLTLRNTGNINLSIDLSPPGGPFARAGGSCGTTSFALAAQASCTLGYTFTPTGNSQTSTVLVATPDIGNFVSIRLVGQGEEGGLRFNPTQLSYPTQASGATAGPLFATLSNTSPTTLTVASLTTASGVYARAGGSCGKVPFTLASQASCTLGYTFTPVWFPGQPTSFQQHIRATPTVGLQAELSLYGEAGRGSLRVDSSLHWIAPIPIGTVSAEKIASLTNVGTAPLVVTAIGPFIVPPVASFVRTPNSCPEPPFTINANWGCNVSYVFTPVFAGEVQLDINFHNNVGSPESLRLRGTGLPGNPVFANGFEGN